MYIEIVTSDLDKTVEMYTHLCRAVFSQPDPDLGFARVAELEGGNLLGARAPLAEHEPPIVRIYLAVPDIATAVEEAQARGAFVAYGPVEQGRRGSFAIVMINGQQHGFWQRP